MNILITGSGGFIGSNLAKKLKESYVVFELYNGSKYSFKNNQILCNLKNIDHVESLLKEDINVDIIIHTAAILASHENIEKLSLFYDNVNMYENLILIINKFNPKKVINFSSIAVYPNKDGRFSEESEIKPSDNSDCLYGLSKFCGENILDFYLKKKNICVIHARISQVYGEGMREDRIMNVMRKELMETGKITVFGMGERVSNFIKIDSLIKKIELLLNHKFSDVFNIGDENISYRNLAESIIKEYGNSESVIEFIDKGVSSKTLIDLSKAKNLLKS